MKRLLKKLILSTQGTSLVELALLMPVALLLIVGSLDMGAMFVRKMDLSNAAKSGVQYALVRKPMQGDLTNITAAVHNTLAGSMTDSTLVNVELYCMCHEVRQFCTVDCTDENVSAFVNVTIKENYQTPFFNYSWFKSSFPISETATIRLN
ncbi:MAG: pilus assembly protein [Emcibacter sp.]|nr:pilus assembly protein [Emcibacter sp.]